MSNAKGKSDVTPTESETTGTVGNFPHGSREIPATSVSLREMDRSVKAGRRTTDAHVVGKSDSSIVPKKQANKGSVLLPAESVEGRELTEENVTSTLLVSDTEPSYRGMRGWAYVKRQRFYVRSQVGAVCGSSARTDLCGGRLARAVPTAIMFLHQKKIPERKCNGREEEIDDD